MPITNDATTYVCLFHHSSQAQAAIADLTEAGVPQSSISVINDSTQSGLERTSLEELSVPDRDLEHLREGIRAGGVVISITALADHERTIEEIFARNRAAKIDEADLAAPVAPLAPPVPTAAVAETAAAVAIPVVEEELVVGKRTVDRGGVRVYRRVVEIPVEQSVNLHEEHVTVGRQLVDRPATDADLAAGSNRTIELTETAEEAVVGKSAHVVEEIRLGRQEGERTEHIQDSVRRTEVDVEQIEPDGASLPPQRNL